MILLGSEVDKIFKILIKTSNAAEYIKSDIQNIKASRIDDPIILVCIRKHTYRVSLWEFLKLFKYLASSSIHTISKIFDRLFKALHQEKGENSHKLCMDTLSCGRLPPIYRHLVCVFFIKKTS